MKITLSLLAFTLSNTALAQGACDDPAMPKCISFSAENHRLTPPCSADQALKGYTVGGGRPPAGKHVFAYTHGFCGPTGSGGVDPTEAAWCKKVAGECKLTYPSADWKGPKGADCLMRHVAKNTPDGAHFEIDNCDNKPAYPGGTVKCFQDLLAGMKKANTGNRRLVLKNVKPEEAAQLAPLLKGPDSQFFSNFTIVEEKFDKAAVQRSFAGTCMSVAKSGEPGSRFNTNNYGVNERHISIAGQGPRPGSGDAIVPTGVRLPAGAR